MIPTLNGRIQTRIFALATVGVLWTLVITPLLPGVTSLATAYLTTFTILGLVLLAGVVWELAYHGLQQFRWEKDWPAFFGLLTGINEGATVWLLAAAVGAEASATAFLAHFITTWIVVWLFVNGPMRVVAIRWRFSGGRFL